MKLKLNRHGINITALFILMFCYGMLLLMVGYTNPELRYITGLSGEQSLLLTIPQSLALIVGVACMQKLLKYFNIRTIMVSGMGMAVLALLFICLLDKISGYNSGQTMTAAVHHKALATFIVADFFLGLGISLVSPISSTYISGTTSGKKRVLWLSLSNGVYGIGAGIIPLTATSTISTMSEGGSNIGYSTLRTFYIIAIAFAVVAFAGAWLLNYNHRQDALNLKDEALATKTEKKQAGQGSMTTKELKKVIGFVVAFFAFYMFVETTFNYSLGNFTGAGYSSASAVRFIQAFGVFVLLQGLYRCVCGIVGQFVKDRYFVIFSVVLMITALCILLGAGVHYKFNNIPGWVPWTVAVIIAFGLGNMWPVLFNFASKLNTKKAVLIGIWANWISMFMIPVTQGIITAIFQSGVPTGQIIVISIGIVASIGIVGIVWWTHLYAKQRKFSIDAALEKHNLV